jgi:hypothetical protein
LVVAILAIRSKFVTEASGFAASACNFRIKGKAAVILQFYRQISRCANTDGTRTTIPEPSTAEQVLANPEWSDGKKIWVPLKT